MIQNAIPFPVAPDLTTATNIIDHPVSDLITTRKSIRAFSDKPVSQQQIDSLFEAARWSFSASNDQPWVYLYATPQQPELWQLLVDFLAEANKTWVSHAQVLILSMSRTHSLKTSKPIFYHLHDVGAANMAMSLQAAAMGLQLHPMGGFDKQKAVADLNIPSDLQPVAMLAGGYPGEDLSMLNEFQQGLEQKRSDRLTQESFVVNKRF